jgi:hypothetical protein
MRSQQQLHFMRQPRAHARAVAQVQEQNQHKIIMMVAYALASAIIVLWMAYVPTLMRGILINLNIVPTHLSSASDSFNRANKDDQLTNVRFNDRWNALAAIKIQTLGENGIHARATDPAKNIQRIPVGCEPAFSPLVKAGNFIARCIASADIPTRLA